MIYALCLVLFMIGLYGVLVKKNILKMTIGLVIMEYATNIFIILLGYRKGGIPPVLGKGVPEPEFLAASVDPLPQAMVLMSIVIGLGLIIFMVALCIRLYERYGTFDITKMRSLKG